MLGARAWRHWVAVWRYISTADVPLCFELCSTQQPSRSRHVECNRTTNCNSTSLRTAHSDSLQRPACTQCYVIAHCRTGAARVTPARYGDGDKSRSRSRQGFSSASMKISLGELPPSSAQPIVVRQKRCLTDREIG